MRCTVALVLVIALLFGASPAAAQRIRDLGAFDGVRANPLTGYGVVVGLPGTGDDNLAYLTEAARGVAGQLGVPLPAGAAPGLKNAAAVIVTAELPAFAKPGQRLDITVSALGKARSLRGGTLILTALKGADGEIYALAQGSVVVGGLGVSARDGSQLTVNIPTVGRIAQGGIVERAVASAAGVRAQARFNLHEADFLTATRVRDAINARFAGTAQITDGVTVIVSLPGDEDAAALRLAEIGVLEIVPAPASARVVVNSRTGTVIINGAVRLAPAAVSHGKLVVRIAERVEVSQPGPLASGRTVASPASEIEASEEGSRLALVAGGADLGQVVDALGTLGVAAADLVAILEGLKQAGALQAELVIL
ncbi:flagellar basal body P-ring protein FlgI [Erythrobacteraceae bacterium CFH 75059]|nr:flagellar basal body P-ring protein FlgI [Qipengyuania thermophila]TCD06286.1 flagellar basal body P-ring protein FlgI [Erythrobacteraceae bacterium CFH 75059]